uniref:BTB/POZ domain-containing protein n=1 Tax=Strongyloides venezuelensis TaxID=75913 RepID=A0A0K0EZY5_STRVS
MFRYIITYLKCLRHGFTTARILPSSVEELLRLSVECALLNLKELRTMAEDMLSSYQSSEDNNYENDLDRFAYFNPTSDRYYLSGDPYLFFYILSYLNCKRNGFVTSGVLPSCVEYL